MINKHLGESVEFSIVVKDQNGTALTSESPVVRLYDFTGTLRSSGTGTHASSGSYTHSINTSTTWGTGPVKYDWCIAGGNGTGIIAETNEVNLLSGTSEPPSYVYESELNSYYDRIGDYLDENSKDKIISKYNYINRLLESLNITAPRQKNDDGLYDQSLRDMNAWMAIHAIVQEKQVNRGLGEDEEPWYKTFKDNALSIYDDIAKKRIVFRDQVSASESGIERATRSLGSSEGTMVTNWDRSYGKGFRGADYPKTWKVQITGTGTAGELNECIFKWTNNDWIGSSTGTTNIGWIGLGDEVYIRWSKGNATGSTNLMVAGDEWQFDTNPTSTQKGGINGAKSYR